MSKISFITFCVEYYAEHIGKTGAEVYELFKKEGVLDLLENDYEDLHGMGMEYLMQIRDLMTRGKKQREMKVIRWSLEKMKAAEKQYGI